MKLSSSGSKISVLVFACLTGLASCTKQGTIDQFNARQGNSFDEQISYINNIKDLLKDSLSISDFAALNFNTMYTQRDVPGKYYYIRIGFKGNKISNDFVLLKTDSTFKTIKARIVHVELDSNRKSKTNNSIVKSSSLSRKEILYIKNASTKKFSNNTSSGNVSSLMAEEGPVGEQILPDVVVTGYIYDDPFPIYWYYYDGMLGLGDDGGYSYTYGSSDPGNGGGGGGSYGSTIQIDYENPENEDPIDLNKYLKCFGATQEADATYTITIATDIPVDGDPSQLFDWSNSTPGHTYIELYKNGSGGLIEQNIGFYPNSAWKTATGNSISSKMADNAGHEYNARYTISVSNTQFQAALTAVQTYSSYEYNIANFNCTDFALMVFNAAGGNLTIPRLQIPGYPNGTIGSNTPQGLYNQLDQMQAAGYSGIQKPGIKGYGDVSHGPCD